MTHFFSSVVPLKRFSFAVVVHTLDMFLPPRGLSRGVLQSCHLLVQLEYLTDMKGLIVLPH